MDPEDENGGGLEKKPLGGNVGEFVQRILCTGRQVSIEREEEGTCLHFYLGF